MTRALIFMSVAWVPAIASPVTDKERESVTIRGEPFNLWPIDDLRARGFEFHEIPREKNSAWVYLKAVNAYEELPTDLADAFDHALYTAWPSGAAKLGDYLALPGNRRAIEVAHQAAGMDAYQMPYFGDPPGSILSVLLPNLSPMRFLGKLMLADGRRLVAQGAYDRAIDRYFDAMRMGAHVGSGMTLIEGLVGIAIWSITDRAVQDMVLREPLSKQQLEMLLRRLNDHAEHLPNVDRGLRGERDFGPTVVDELCSRPMLLPTIFPFDTETGDISFMDGRFNGYPTDGWGRLELRIGKLFLPDRAVKRHMDDYYDRVRARADGGPRSAAALSFDEERYIKESIPEWDVLSRFLLPSLSRVITLGERLKTDFAVTRALVAIRLHMLEHDGTWPDDLQAVADALPEGALADPFGERWLRYLPTGEGFTLYSVGPDLVDDGGRKGERWDLLDMVFSYPPPAPEPFGEQGD
jgi:hypothetical protein